MERARHLAVALQLADVADIDQHGVGAAVELQRFFNRQRFDLALGLLDQRLDTGGDGLGHCNLRCEGSWQTGNPNASVRPLWCPATGLRGSAQDGNLAAEAAT